jgi:hypothetical protein
MEKKMKQVTREMIQDFKIKRLGYDFMGYTFKLDKELSYHHLIIPNRKGGPITRWNGSVLVMDTSHSYLHRIESRDEEIFYLITSEMIDQNVKGKLDVENLKRIRDLLEYFEKEHCTDRTSKKKPLIKEEYIRRRIKL